MVLKHFPHGCDERDMTLQPYEESPEGRTNLFINFDKPVSISLTASSSVCCFNPI